MSGVRDLPAPTRGKWKLRWAVDSDGLDNEYTVALDDYGNYGCSCPAWKFQRTRHGPDWQCKHIDAVQVWREQAFRRHHEPSLQDRMNDMLRIMELFRSAVANKDVERIAELRAQLQAYRGLTSICTATIDDTIAAADTEIMAAMLNV